MIKEVIQMNKIRISPNAWMVILLTILSIFLLYAHKARFSMTSVFNLQSVQMVEIMWGLFLVYMLGNVMAKHLSPKLIHCQGHSTWIPLKPALLKVPRNSAGKQPCPDIRIFQRTSFMALNFYIWDYGKHGYELTWDVPGMWSVLGDSAIISSKKRKCYVGKRQHEKLGFIFDLLKEYCDSVHSYQSIAKLWDKLYKSII